MPDLQLRDLSSNVGSDTYSCMATGKFSLTSVFSWEKWGLIKQWAFIRYLSDGDLKTKMKPCLSSVYILVDDDKTSHRIFVGKDFGNLKILGPKVTDPELEGTLEAT